MIDLHVHTWRCRHATGEVGDYVAAAIQAGVRTLAITEHMPLAPALMAIPGAAGYAMPAAELPEYVTEITGRRECAADRGVELLLGIEADLVPESFDHVREVLAAHPFDVVLGSVHFIDGWAFDDPERADGYAGRDIDAMWERYFADVVTAARTGLADVIGHIDLVKKFGYRPNGPSGALYHDLACALAETGVAVEVNTAGLRKPCAEIYPGDELLAALSAAGVPVTIGSDAHAPSEVGYGAVAAITALERAGYRSALVFRQRVPEEVALDDL
ncbi:MAG: histidinol-phosphatase HisJ family protein [Aeromicrobium sp.]|nr:histidinol-phosphatase HisJ family protein [Aeromicrobium sp.]